VAVEETAGAEAFSLPPSLAGLAPQAERNVNKATSITLKLQRLFTICDLLFMKY
jgi:hypothetical protein